MPVEFIGMIATEDQSETRLSRGPIIDKDFTRRFVRAHEYPDILKLAWTSAEPFSYHGAYYQVEDHQSAAAAVSA
jgi:alkanesulfonate monooxygenase